MTVALLRSWSTHALPGAARSLADTADLLTDVRAQVSTSVGGMVWDSPAGDGARAVGADLRAALGTLAASFAMQAEVVSRVAGAVDAAQALLDRAQGLADEHGLTMLDDGRVLGPPPVAYASDTPDDEVDEILRGRQDAVDGADRASALAVEALAGADEADRAAAQALSESDRLGAMLSGLVPQAVGLLLTVFQDTSVWAAVERDRLLDAVDGRAVPDPGTGPDEVSAWWASLPASQQAALAAGAPDALGNLDGLPAAVRDAANRLRLVTVREELEAEALRLRRALDENVFGGAFTFDDGRLEDVEAELDALDRIEEVLAPPATDRYLLVLDASQEQMMAAIGNHDVDTADHVAVFTPGLTTTVQDSLVSYDRQLTDLRRQADDLAARAGTGSVATVAWLGYQAPQWSDWWRPSRTVLDDAAAAAGAERLEAFLDGLDGARDVPAHLTALGHSYGSLTTGLALQRGTPVDDVVFFGSPGIGTSHVDDLGLRPGRVYVVEARGDAVADLAAFGDDPNGLDGVTGLSAARSVVERVERAESVGHSEYLVDGTTSQYGLAAVTAGLPELAVRDDGTGLGDLLRDRLAEPLPTNPLPANPLLVPR